MLCRIQKIFVTVRFNKFTLARKSGGPRTQNLRLVQRAMFSRRPYSAMLFFLIVISSSTFGISTSMSSTEGDQRQLQVASPTPCLLSLLSSH